MGLLDGGLQRVALGAFGAILLTGRFQPQVAGQTRNQWGVIQKGDKPEPMTCKAFYERVTDEMRLAGYGNRDVQIVMLQLTPEGVQIPQPVAGDVIELRGQLHAVAEPIDQDPAMAAWTFRGTPTTIRPAEPQPDEP